MNQTTSAKNYQDYGKPVYLMRFTKNLIPWLISLTTILIMSGLFLGLYIAPSDFQQGEMYRIIYIHVPAAWMSLFVYVCVCIASLHFLITKNNLSALIAKTSSKIGIVFTVITLVTGSLWGKPMWGTYWVWDARLTSVLVLFFLYLGYLLLDNAFEDRQQGSRMAALLAVIGVINIPIIKFSVNWWNTLHQPSSITQFQSSIHISMVIPIFLISLAFMVYFVLIFSYLLRGSLIKRRIYRYI